MFFHKVLLSRHNTEEGGMPFSFSGCPTGCGNTFFVAIKRLAKSICIQYQKGHDVEAWWRTSMKKVHNISIALAVEAVNTGFPWCKNCTQKYSLQLEPWQWRNWHKIINMKNRRQRVLPPGSSEWLQNPQSGVWRSDVSTQSKKQIISSFNSSTRSLK